MEVVCMCVSRQCDILVVVFFFLPVSRFFFFLCVCVLVAQVIRVDIRSKTKGEGTPF